MKTAVFVGLFILVACLQPQANGAEFTGKTDDCKHLPEGVGNTCHRWTCDDKSGQYTVQTCGVSSIHCENGEPAHHPEDLTKLYPDCCSKPYCKV